MTQHPGDGPMWWEKENTACPDCGHLFHQHYPDCHRPCEEQIKALMEAVSDLHSVVDNAQWEQLEDETQKIALKVHEELWHAGD